jgi:methionyl-tRNA synthetase
VLYAVLDALRSVATLVRPMMPHVSAAIWDQLGVTTPLDAERWQDAREAGRLKPGTTVRVGQPIFPRIDTKRKMDERASPAPAAAPIPEAPATPVITIDDFKKVTLKVARVLSAERIPKADKLLHLTVDAGEEAPRSLIAGIAQHYAPEDLVGLSVIIVANLLPATIRGVESNGMVLAGEADGKVVLLGPQGELPPGTGVR